MKETYWFETPEAIPHPFVRDYWAECQREMEQAVTLLEHYFEQQHGVTQLFHRQLFLARSQPETVYADDGNTRVPGTRYDLQHAYVLLPSSEGWLPWIHLGERPRCALSWHQKITFRNSDLRCVQGRDRFTEVHVMGFDHQESLFRHHGWHQSLQPSPTWLADASDAIRKVLERNRQLVTFEKLIDELEIF